MFEYYFFKKSTREYDSAEYFSFLMSFKYMQIFLDEDNNKNILYHNTDLDFKATFVFGRKTRIKNLYELDPNYLDTNIYVAFDALQSDFKVKLILEIIGLFCKKFGLYVYTKHFEDVFPYKEKMCLKAYLLEKRYTKNHENERLLDFAYIESKNLKKIYNYLLSSDKIRFSLKNEQFKSLKYRFYQNVGTRTPIISCILEFDGPIIIPPLINTIGINTDGHITFYDYDRIFKKISKLTHKDDLSSDEYSYVMRKDLKKLKKIIMKQKQAVINVSSPEIKLNRILDI